MSDKETTPEERAAALAEISRVREAVFENRIGLSKDIHIRVGKPYLFSPNPDITAFELATLLPVLLATTTGVFSYDWSGWLEKQDETVRRHFTKMPAP